MRVCPHFPSGHHSVHLKSDKRGTLKHQSIKRHQGHSHTMTYRYLLESPPKPIKKKEGKKEKKAQDTLINSTTYLCPHTFYGMNPGNQKHHLKKRNERTPPPSSKTRKLKTF